jgi:hypothetical protein
MARCPEKYLGQLTEALPSSSPQVRNRAGRTIPQGLQHLRRIHPALWVLRSGYLARQSHQPMRHRGRRTERYTDRPCGGQLRPQRGQSGTRRRWPARAQFQGSALWPRPQKSGQRECRRSATACPGLWSLMVPASHRRRRTGGVCTSRGSGTASARCSPSGSRAWIPPRRRQRWTGRLRPGRPPAGTHGGQVRYRPTPPQLRVWIRQNVLHGGPDTASRASSPTYAAADGQRSSAAQSNSRKAAP